MIFLAKNYNYCHKYIITTNNYFCHEIDIIATNNLFATNNYYRHK